MHTTQYDTKLWSVEPTIIASSDVIGAMSVSWETPAQFAQQDMRAFIIEYRLPNETEWRRYGKEMPYQPGQQTYQVWRRHMCAHTRVCRSQSKASTRRSSTNCVCSL